MIGYLDSTLSERSSELFNSTLFTDLWALGATAATADFCSFVYMVLVSVTLDSLTELSEVSYLDEDSLEMLDWSSVSVVPSDMLEDSVGCFAFATIAFGWFNVDDFSDVVGPGSSSAKAPTDSSSSSVSCSFSSYCCLICIFCAIILFILSSFFFTSDYFFFISGESLYFFYFFGTLETFFSTSAYFTLFFTDFFGAGAFSAFSSSITVSVLGTMAL